VACGFELLFAYTSCGWVAIPVFLYTWFFFFVVLGHFMRQNFPLLLGKRVLP
jgi:hypothetical protein